MLYGNYYLKLVDGKNEFYQFLKKFRGSLIFRGNSCRSYKLFDEILFIIKRRLSINPLYVLFNVYKRLMPIFDVSYKRMGNRYQAIPKLSTLNRRIVLVIDWLIRSMKGKSNVFGLKVLDVANNIIDTFNNKGRALQNKKLFYKVSLYGRHFIRPSGDFIKSYNIFRKISRKNEKKKKTSRTKR